MIRGYANRGSADKSYIGAIAELLCQYPRALALECADPIRGVVLNTKFMPTPADIAGWMESHVDRMKHRLDAEEGAARQLHERREYERIRGPQKPIGGSQRANLLVRPDRPGYAQVCERAKYSDPLDFQYAANGIWVPRHWYDERNSWRPPKKEAVA